MMAPIQSGESLTPESKKRILLVAATTGYQTRSFGEAGRRLGVEIIMATDRCHVMEDPWGDHAIPLRFEQPHESASDLTVALAGMRVDGVVGLGDRPAWIAALAAEKLGVPFHPAEATGAAGDKKLARERFAAAGLPVPDNCLMSADTEPKSAPFYPCVLKPLGLSASRGVIRADDDREFRDAFARIRAILSRAEIRRLRDDRNGLIQVERYIDGREFAVEGIVTGGRVQTLAIFDKPDPLEGPYFEETIYLTPSREPEGVRHEIELAACRAVAALGLSHGPIHAEMRANPNGVFLLEVAPRPIGGLCSRAIRFPGGATLEEAILRHATGEEIPDTQAEAAGVMMIPIPRAGLYQGVAGVREALAVPGIDDVIITAKPGQELLPLPEGASYLGFIFGHGDGAEESIRKAHSCLSFEISRTLPISAS
jgi:biotin carboxylase